MLHVLPRIARRFAFLFGSALCGAAFFGSLPAIAQTQNIIFTIDPTSIQTLSGNDPSSTPFIGQGGSGGLTAGVVGSFSLNFDPTTDLSTASAVNIQFPGTTSGFFQITSPTTTGTPGLQGSSTPSPANFAGQGTNGFDFAWRNIDYNFFSNTLTSASVSGGVATFDAHPTNFNVNSARLDMQNPGHSINYAGSPNLPLDVGNTWQLSQPSPGTWSLQLSGSYTSTYTSSNIPMVFTANITATAHFDLASNQVTNVPPQVGQSNPVTVSVPAGAATPTSSGAIELTLPTTNTSDVTSVSVQQIPITAISQAGETAAKSSPIFTAADNNAGPGADAQVWEVSPIGFINDGTQSATLKFYFDPSLFTANELATLGIWHFNTVDVPPKWEFGGMVHLADQNDPTNYITYTTTSFSQFVAADSSAFADSRTFDLGPGRRRITFARILGAAAAPSGPSGQLSFTGNHCTLATGRSSSRAARSWPASPRGVGSCLRRLALNAGVALPGE